MGNHSTLGTTNFCRKLFWEFNLSLQRAKGKDSGALEPGTQYFSFLGVQMRLLIMFPWSPQVKCEIESSWSPVIFRQEP